MNLHNHLTFVASHSCTVGICRNCSSLYLKMQVFQTFRKFCPI